MRRKGSEVDGATRMVAVGVVDQEAVVRVVDDMVVGIVRSSADMEEAGRQDARVTDPLEDGPIEDNLVDVHGEVGDTVEIGAGAEVRLEDELVLAGAAGQCIEA